ncbi:hypothetical protein J6590_037594 [Homalodisca vitripennis]|nr:hypothetical protein J6590_037594 [Homalodisca vitripennis]
MRFSFLTLNSRITQSSCIIRLQAHNSYDSYTARFGSYIGEIWMSICGRTVALPLRPRACALRFVIHPVPGACIVTVTGVLESGLQVRGVTRRRDHRKGHLHLTVGWVSGETYDRPLP